MKLISIIFALTLLAGCATEPPRPASVKQGDYASVQAYATKLIQYEMDRNSVAGLSIALVDDQRIIWAQGFGYADIEKKTPATADTLYRIASISKLFTDTAAMQLAEQGKIDIDQPLRNYLPGFEIKTRYPNAGEITPRQLMTHHSGLPRDRLKGFMNPHPASYATVVADIRDEYLAYPPGRVFSYSNLGIELLGNAIQAQSGIPFADYMRESVLAPLDMSNSSFATDLSPSPLMAKGYLGRAQAIEPPMRDVPAGGLNSSVNDLSHFMSMVFAGGTYGNHRILKAETLAEMLRPQNAAVPLDFDFRIGLGWMLNPAGMPMLENAGPVAGHNGGLLLFRSQLYILPGHKLGVVVLSNSSTSGEVVEHVAKAALSLALEAKSGIRQPERVKVQPDDKPLSAETVQDCVGDYTTVAGYMRIYEGNNGLHADAAGHSLDLVRGSDGLFRLDYSILGVFHVDLGQLGEIGFSRRTVDGRDLLVLREGGEDFLFGQRIKPLSNLDKWRRHLGDYEITNLEGDHKFVEQIRLVEERGLLFVELTMADKPKVTARVPLSPVSDSEALMLGPLSDGGETIHLVKVNGEERVMFSGYLLKKIARSD